MVGGGESTEDGAVHVSSTDVTLKEGATGADFKECKESSGKHLKLTYCITGGIASHGLHSN